MTIVMNCPECGEPMVVRKNSITEEDFLGCSQYPACKHTEPIPPDVRMRLMGVQPLPGMEP